MSLVATFGLLSSLLTVARTGAQAAHLARTSADGVSETGWVLMLLLGGVWTVYGLSADVFAMVVTNLANGVLALVVVELVAYRRHTVVRTSVRAVIASLATAAGIVWCILSHKLILLSTVAVIATIFLYLPQLLRVIRERKLEGISLSSWTMACAQAIGWAVYGIMIQKPPVYLPSVVLIPSSIVIIVRTIQVGRR